MDMSTRPFERMTQIMKEATFYGNEKSEAVNWANMTSIKNYLIKVYDLHRDNGFPMLNLFRNLDVDESSDEDEFNEDEFNEDEIKDVNKQQNRLYYRINLLSKKDLKRFCRGIKTMNDLKDLVEALKFALEKNVGKQFCNKQLREEAIAKLDKELNDITRFVEKTKKQQRYAKLSADKQNQRKITDERGKTTVEVTRMMDELASICEQLEELLGEEIPDIVENEILDDDFANWFVVRKRAQFFLKGQDRTVAYAVLDTPLTHNAQLIRLGSDYWADVKHTFELNDDAFYIKSMNSMEEAVSEILNAISREIDLNDSLFEIHDHEEYDTFESLQEKIQKLLVE